MSKIEALVQSDMTELCLVCRLQRRARDLRLPMTAALTEARQEELALRERLECPEDSRLCRLCNIETDLETMCQALMKEMVAVPSLVALAAGE